MAPSAKQISLFLLLTIFSSSSSIHARDGQFFNKNPSATNPDTTLPRQDQPDFVPDNDDNNAFGLYGRRDHSDLPPTKYLPKNYNPVAYVTEPESTVNDDNTPVSFTEDQKTYATNPTNYFNNNNNGQKSHDDESAYKTYPTTLSGDNNYYYNGGSSFNSDPDRFNPNYFDNGAGADGYQPQDLKDTTTLFGAQENSFDNAAGTDGYQPEELTDTKLSAGRDNYFDAGAGVNGYRPQGMSDTRSLENGKYFYDMSSEKYSTDHPYERLRGARPTYHGGFP